MALTLLTSGHDATKIAALRLSIRAVWPARSGVDLAEGFRCSSAKVDDGDRFRSLVENLHRNSILEQLDRAQVMVAEPQSLIFSIRAGEARQQLGMPKIPTLHA